MVNLPISYFMIYSIGIALVFLYLGYTLGVNAGYKECHRELRQRAEQNKTQVMWNNFLSQFGGGKHE